MYRSEECPYCTPQPKDLAEAKAHYGTSLGQPIAKPTYNNDVKDKEKWIAALLDGSYEQGTGRLCQIEIGPDNSEKKRYCCLGVYAELQNVPSERAYLAGNFMNFLFPSKTGEPVREKGLPTTLFANEHGFATANGAFIVEFKLFGEDFWVEYNLASLNDSGLTFAQIADLVRHFF